MKHKLYKKKAPIGRSVDDLYRLDRFERMKTEWVEAQGSNLTMQAFEAEMRRLKILCGLIESPAK